MEHSRNQLHFYADDITVTLAVNKLEIYHFLFVGK